MTNENMLARPYRHDMATSAFDVITSFLLACLLLLAATTTVLAFFWWFSGPAKPVAEEMIPGRILTASFGQSQKPDFDVPADQEVAPLSQASVDETLDHLVEIASQVAAASQGMPDSTENGTGGSSLHTLGDPAGEDIVPRHERWQLNFVANRLSEYARQLDDFGIELAVIGGEHGVDTAKQFQSGPVVGKILDTKGEKRLYFMHLASSSLETFDRQLLQRAEISTAGRHVIQFIAKSLENQLAIAELEYASSRGHERVVEIQRTVFQSKRVGAQFRFEVVAQDYRTPRRQ